MRQRKKNVTPSIPAKKKEERKEQVMLWGEKSTNKDNVEIILE